VVVGSIKPASRRQVDRAREAGAQVVFDAAMRHLDSAVGLADGRDVILVAAPERVGDLREDPAVADRLAARAVAIAASSGSRGIVLVGGELSSSFLERAGAHRGRVVVEPWPAAPVLRLHGGILDGQKVLTKSGAQGDDAWLEAALAVMRSLGAVAPGEQDA
jgi:uncharacterized protein YgbK (DUF1537 family)